MYFRPKLLMLAVLLWREREEVLYFRSLDVLRHFRRINHALIYQSKNTRKSTEKKKKIVAPEVCLRDTKREGAIFHLLTKR